MQKEPAISVCIPARDEERYIGACLESIRQSENKLGAPVEIIVVLNRCTDRTEDIALSYGARIVREDAKNLSRIRNAGCEAARAPILVTVDADSRMTENMLPEIKRRLDSGAVVGGGVLIKPDRWSAGILMSVAVITTLVMLPFGISAGVFWCRKEDFEKIGGFNEKFLTGEDVEFAFRLKKAGKAQGKKFDTIWNAHIVSSTRKFDKFGDWYLLNPKIMYEVAKGRREQADKLWYDTER